MSDETPKLERIGRYVRIQGRRVRTWLPLTTDLCVTEVEDGIKDKCQVFTSADRESYWSCGMPAPTFLRALEAARAEWEAENRCSAVCWKCGSRDRENLYPLLSHGGFIFRECAGATPQQPPAGERNE